MNKRGQIAIFVIIAVLVIIGILIFFIVKSKQPSSSTQISENDKEEIRNYVQQCIDKNLEDGINFVSFQGGYALLNEPFFETNLTSAAYGFFRGERTLPSKQRVADEISDYVKAFTYFCINNSNFALDISAYNFDSQTTIMNNYVKLDVNFPITISDENESVKLSEKYSSKINSPLGSLYNTASEIVDLEVKDPQNVNLTYMINSPYKIIAVSYEPKTILYIISDVNETSGDVSLFRFANEFT